MGCLRLASLLFLGVSLALGAASRDARADACGKLGLENGCVWFSDFKKKTLNAKKRKDEAGVAFDSKPDEPLDLDFTPKSFASVVVKAPAAGTVIVTADLTVQALENPAAQRRDGHGQVDCRVTVNGSGFDTSRARMFGQVDLEDDLQYDAIAFTFSQGVQAAGLVRFELFCQVVRASVPEFEGEKLVKIRSPSLVAAYYSSRT